MTCTACYRRVPALLLILTLGCVTTNAAVMNPGITRAPICPEGVALFSTPDRVTTGYEEVALLNSTGYQGSDEAKMMESMRKKAGEVGANGIIMGGIDEPNAATKVLGAFLGTGTQRKGKSLAIYIPADSARVQQACSAAGRGE